MTDPDPIPRCIDAFDREKGGGVSICKSRGGYTRTLAATQAPIARLKPEGPGDRMRLYYWYWQNRWKDVGDMGGNVLPHEEALDKIANANISRTWT